MHFHAIKIGLVTIVLIVVGMLIFTYLKKQEQQTFRAVFFELAAMQGADHKVV